MPSNSSETPRQVAPAGGSKRKPFSPSLANSRTTRAEADRESSSQSVFDIPPGYRKLLDAFDAVRRLDSTTKLDLPTLVVSGTTSAGKSSVLEAITGLNFPRAAGRCTRYATVVSMRREDDVSIRLYTTGSGGKEFERILKGDEALAEIHDIILDEVAEHFGVLSNDTFSDGVLNIDYHGPTLPLLTVVDTPGFVSAENFPQDSPLIKSIVSRYINKEKKNTIVLAIVSASDATDNQGILGIMKDLDPEHERTLGIITKPDKAIGNKDVLKLAQNKDPNWKMKHAWHVLRNYDTVDGDVDLHNRNLQELEFFGKKENNWSDFPSEQKGIGSLVTRLQRLLHEQAKRAMRPILSQLRTGLKSVSQEVKQLEIYFGTIEDRRREFKVACRNLADIAHFGINGSYKDPYFRKGTDQRRRLRHSIRRATSSFIVQIRGIHGPPIIHEEHKDRRIHDSGIGTPTNETNSTDLPPWNSETVENLDEKWKTEVMKELLDNSQGEELPGDVDPQRLNLLFWEISSNWKTKAIEHTKDVNRLSMEFIELVIDDWCLRPENGYSFIKPEPDTIAKLKALIEPTFELRLEAALKELDNIEGDRVRAAQTTDPVVWEKAKSLRWERLFKTLNKKVEGHHTVLEAAQHAGVSNLAEERERQGEDFLDKCLLYYHSALTRYQDNVVVQVVERHILNGLEKPLRDVDLLGGDAALDQILTSDDEEQKEMYLIELKERQKQFRKCEEELTRAV